MKFINALEQAEHHIKTLWTILILLCVINVITMFGWMHSQSKIKVDVPPAIPESGLTLTEGQAPKTTVFSFAFYVWQSLNHWPSDGTKNYKQQITAFAPFLTPQFKFQLIENYNQLLSEGELQDRIRLMQGIAGSNFSPIDVRYLGHGTWQVVLNMRLTELLNNNANIVKDVEMQYVLKVVRFNVGAKQNPWGLALAGFAENPKRIKTIV